MNLCCLFLWCDALDVFREKGAMGRASIQCLIFGLSTEAETCRKVAQVTPICRALAVVMSSRRICKVTRKFG